MGFSNTGWCLFDGGTPLESGCIKTKKNALKFPKSKFRVTKDNERRCNELAAELIQLIKTREPKAVIGELPTGGAKSAAALSQMAMATAIAVIVPPTLGIPSIWSTPIDGKRALLDKSSGEKDEMMWAVRDLYPDILWPKTKNVFEHVADSVASYHALIDHPLVQKFG